MSFDKNQLREMISKVLDYLGLNTPSAVEILMMTAAQESGLGRYLKQLKGPARGIFQIEPNTEKFVWDLFLKKKPELISKIQALKNTVEIPGLSDMETDLDYQIAMARLVYYRIPAALPASSNIKALAEYYKKYYNTYLGKATVEEVISNYKKYC